MFFWNSCFFYDPVDVGNLISGSSAYFKSILNIWKFMVHVLAWSLAWRILSITLLVCEMSAIVQKFGHSLALPFFEIGMKTNPFQSCSHCWVFQICWHIECGTFTASSFRIWDNSTGIPSPPLALFIVILPNLGPTWLSPHLSSLVDNTHPVVWVWGLVIISEYHPA